MQLVPSLDSLLDFWQQQSQRQGVLGELARVLQAQIEAHPQLRGPLQSDVLEEQSGLIEALVSAVFPPSLERMAFAALATPGTFEFHWATPRFRRELLDDQGRLRGHIALEGMDWDYLRELFQFLQVARECYGRHFAFEKSVVLELDENGLSRFYQFRAHFDHFRLKSPPQVPTIEERDWSRLAQNLQDLQLWRSFIELDQFELYGLVVYEANNITEEVTLSAIKQELIARDPFAHSASFERIQSRFRALLNLPDLQVRVLAYQEGSLLDLGCEGEVEVEWTRLCDQLQGDCQRRLSEGRPWVSEDLRLQSLDSPLLSQAREQGAASLLLLPLQLDGEWTGVLSCHSNQPGALNHLTASRLQEVTPLLALAVRRSLEAVQFRIERIIKERFTALHPAVEWKFRQQAREILRARHDLEALSQDIVFADVFPLFGSSDVRNSTVIRNQTVQQDLTRQLDLASKVLENAYQERPLSYLCSRRYRLKQWLQRLAQGLDSGDEQRIGDFLRHDIEPLFSTLARFSASSQAAVEEYQRALDARLGTVYEQRRHYEQSMAWIKETIASLLSQRQQEAQAIFPHYFELHKTDGVDHTLYVGPAIHPQGSFDPLYLKNLRLWQLETMIEIARECQKITEQMTTVLATAHLLLVQDQPLSIRFTQDEKQFAVDGSYNARYEILKKRLDKAEVRQTGERLTQPGKVAIVYSHPREASEYRDYIEYLQHRGQLEELVEELEIAPLQGVDGLRCLRISVRFSS